MSIRRLFAALALATLIAPALADTLQDGIAAANRKDYPAAIRLLEPPARAGNAIAQLRLGLLHYHGHGVRESDAQALMWFERAARQGLAEAQVHLGNMYAYGLADPGGDIDPGRGIKRCLPPTVMRLWLELARSVARAEGERVYA